MRKGQLEALIREQIIGIYKKYVGKGPKDTTIRISKNFIILEFKDVLTPFEKVLLKNKENGEKEILNIRNQMSDFISKEYIHFLENLICIKVIDFLLKTNIKSNVEYGLIIFESDIEDNLETKASL